jgi:DNA phosphorothioation-associated putative methyltransferase
MDSDTARNTQLDLNPAIERGRTALHRTACSRPVTYALNAQVLRKELSFFDYGCGHGDDLRLLEVMGYDVKGWDPNHRPDSPKTQADVVNMGFVLNVIEDRSERDTALHSAFELANKALIVSVRVDSALEHSETEDFADGVVTQRATFQKIYQQAEFQQYIETTIGQRVHTVGLGIGIAFKCEEEETAFLARRAYIRHHRVNVELVELFERDQAAQKYVAKANELGRLPAANEFADLDQLLQRFGSLKRVQRLTLRYVDPEQFIAVRDERSAELMTYLAMLRLRGIKPPQLKTQPADVQADIKACFGSYKAAQEASEAFLFSMGKAEAVQAAMRQAPVGKKVGDSLYVHHSAVGTLPALLRLLIFAAEQVVGEVNCEVIKFAKEGRAISFLSYPEFDTDPHPALAFSMRVFLPKFAYKIRDYRASENPPVLHRKETFIDATHKAYTRYRKLTQAEEKAELLSHFDIGFRKQWLELLNERGYSISNHKLERVSV